MWHFVIDGSGNIAGTFAVAGWLTTVPFQVALS